MRSVISRFILRHRLEINGAGLWLENLKFAVSDD